MDKLDMIFEMQAALNKDIREKRNLNFSREEWIQKQTLAMQSELAELIAEVNFKWWKNPKPIDEQAVKEEIIDVMHFFVSMCLTMGMTADEVFDIYRAKNKENFDRQYGRSAKSGYELDRLSDK